MKKRSFLNWKRTLVFFFVFILFFLYLIFINQKHKISNNKLECKIIPLDSIIEKKDITKIISVKKKEKKKKERIPKKAKLIEKKEISILDKILLETSISHQNVNLTLLDTIKPKILLDPPGGLFDKSIIVNVKLSELSTILIKYNSSNSWDTLNNQEIFISKQVEFKIKAIDTVGNISEIKTEKYKFEYNRNNKCASGMVLIKSLKDSFCIDVYEWPNKKNSIPKDFINWFAALDSCKSVKKRLCTANEWNRACSIGRRLYPYGHNYKDKCNTNSNRVFRSGKFVECRSYNGVYDLSGNLAEWTSTVSAKDNEYYEVYGGFWNSKNMTSCNQNQYSFSPNNKNVSVGFRCCSSIK